MKIQAFLISILLFLFSINSFAQYQLNQSNFEINENDSNSTIYKLFPTKNFWTFIKLDTRNGKMWQVHFTLDEDGTSGEVPINLIPLVISRNEIKGRFTLYPTENIYNFLLLDQIDGYVYQVQWSFEEKDRVIIPLNK